MIERGQYTYDELLEMVNELLKPKKMIRHITASIDYVLQLTDEQLSAMFEGITPAELRADLEERKTRGEKKIGSANCEGFDPVTGCPGHPDRKN